MNKLLATAFITLAALCSPVHAAFKNGNKIFDYGKETAYATPTYGAGFFMGYVMGVHDAYEGITFCAPNNVTGEQIGDIVMKYLYNNPAERNDVASTLVSRALTQAYPCKK